MAKLISMIWKSLLIAKKKLKILIYITEKNTFETSFYILLEASELSADEFLRWPPGQTREEQLSPPSVLCGDEWLVRYCSDKQTVVGPGPLTWALTPAWAGRGGQVWEQPGLVWGPGISGLHYQQEAVSSAWSLFVVRRTNCGNLSAGWRGEH